MRVLLLRHNQIYAVGADHVFFLFDSGHSSMGIQMLWIAFYLNCGDITITSRAIISEPTKVFNVDCGEV